MVSARVAEEASSKAAARASSAMDMCPLVVGLVGFVFTSAGTSSIAAQSGFQPTIDYTNGLCRHPCTGGLHNPFSYHASMEADLRISVNDYRHNENLKTNKALQATPADWPTLPPRTPPSPPPHPHPTPPPPPHPHSN